MSSFARTFFNNLGQTIATGIGSAHSATQMQAPPQRGMQKRGAPPCTPCAARAMVAQAKTFRGPRP
jgi:hypothetical protein